MNIEGVEFLDPLELVIKGSGTTVGYACVKCGASFLVRKHSDERIYEDNRKCRQEEAAQHCVKTCPCGKLIEDSYRLRCRACRQQIEVDKERAFFEKSAKLAIEQYDGVLYWEGHTGSLGDDYFSDIDEILDYCEQEGVDVPEYVWTCKPEEMQLDAERVIESAIWNMFEDARDYIPTKHVAALQAYLDVWCKEANVISWSRDRTRSVLLQEDAVVQAG